ncbi:MAG: GldG family protein [Ignavibacteria bacterium]|jgi:gliding-associated putative ABC transporter substrate-binding component GldG
MLTKRKVQTSILLVVGIILLANVISDRFFLRLDFTADQRYSLSEATEEILNNLTDPVTVTAYFSENLPPDIEKVRTDFKDLLTEYSNLAGGQLVYEFVNPNENQETEMEAQQSGISPLMINVRERDQVKQQRAYLGALIQIGEQKEAIPVIQPGAAMEYELSSNIKKLTIVDKPKLALLQGNGEPGLAQLQQFNELISVMYEIDTLNLADTNQISSDYKALVVVAPKDSIPVNYFSYFDDYLRRGGRIALALNRVEGDLSTSSGSEVSTGFEEWVKGKGVNIEKNFVIDINCTNVMVRQQQGIFVMNTPVSFPYIPIITNFTDHPITNGLESVLMPFVSEIKIEPKDTSITYIPLAVTSDKSGVNTLPLFFNVQKQWRNSDFGLKSIPVAVAVEGNLAGNTNSKMVVFGDGDFIVNGEGQGARQLQPDNINLMVNAIDWLADDTGLVELRTKGIAYRPLDPDLEDSTKAFLKYFNFLLPIVLIIIYGVIRSQVRKKSRNKLQSVSYVEN